MNMQAFYKRLSVKPSRKRDARLTNLTGVSRSQILQATQAGTWLIWDPETFKA